MNKSYGLVLLSVVVLMGISPAKAQNQMGNIPQFLPTGGWTVQQSAFSEARGLEGINLPCMMATSYNNGYSLRFSGSNQKILAMAIDFRQDVFVQGRKYPASLSVDGTYNRNLSGTAFSKSVLIFNMRELGGFYSAISDAVKMTLDVEDNPMMFALGGINNALVKLDSCSGGDGQPAAVQEASIPAADSQAASPMAWEEDVLPVSARVSRDIKKAEVAKAPIWEAKAGDDMKSTLEGWAIRAGVQLDWQADQGGIVTDDVKVQGSFEDAVQTLMARNAAALGLDANLKAAPQRRSTSSEIKQVSTSPQQLVPSRMMAGGVSKPVTMTAAGASNQGRWSAPVGASLQQVLQTWSKAAGVELVWEANQGFAVRLPVNAGGSYEQALQSLLNQYADEKLRPNAQLNNDPVTGCRTLFIQSSRVL